MKTTSQVTTVSLILAVALLSAGSLQAAKAPRGHKNPIPPGQKVGPLPRPMPRPPLPDRRPQAPYIAPQPGPAMWGRSVSPVAPASPRMVVQRSTGVSGTPVQRSRQGMTPGANLLAEAYLLLSRTDHDYQGHRTRAMRQTSAAANLLGVTLHDDGVRGEDRLTSDEQVRKAQALLEQASSFYAGRPKVLQHVNAAHRQVLVALNTR